MQASLARIAQRAGVAKSAVLYHFANKGELVEQVLMAVSLASAAPLPERMAVARGARDMLRVAIETIAELVDGNRTNALAGLETWNQTRSLPGRARLAEDAAAAGVEDVSNPLPRARPAVSSASSTRTWSPCCSGRPSTRSRSRLPSPYHRPEGVRRPAGGDVRPDDQSVTREGPCLQ